MHASEDELKRWMAGGLDGDASAYAALLHAIVPLLRSFYQKQLNGTDECVEKLVQDTLLSIHTRRSSYDSNRPFTVWLYAIARYRLIDHCRLHKKRADRRCLEHPAVSLTHSLLL